VGQLPTDENRPTVDADDMRAKVEDVGRVAHEAAAKVYNEA
jgi:hypothetical protein